MKGFRVASVLVLCIGAIAVADDVRQFRGQHRDGIFAEQGLLQAWPDGGPVEAWAAQGIGGGFSSPIIVDGKIYVTGMLDENAGNLFVLDEATGAIEKTYAYGPETLNDQAQGPRSTPTWDEGHLYFLSGPGVVYCMNAADGAILWSVDMVGRFAARKIIWDYSESLLVTGNRVYCTPGGPKALMAALDKMTGETIWTTPGLEDMASYCSPVLIQHRVAPMLLNATGENIIGVDPDTGRLRWSFYHKVNWNL